MLELELPFPPSVNTYWRHPTKGKLAGRHLISEKGREYRLLVFSVVLNNQYMTITSPVRVDMEVQMPDKRRHDLDNIPKAVFDALTHAKVWGDDNQVIDFRVWKSENTKGGKIILKITEVAHG